MKDVFVPGDTANQRAPWPTELADLVEHLRYKHGRWQFWLDANLDRGQGSQGLTLVVLITEPDAYNPDHTIRVNHYFPVPPAAYDVRSWRRWLFEQILLVERHEAMEGFALKDVYSFKDDSLCELCDHSVHNHDGRDESCVDCPITDGIPYTHRFVVKPEDQIYSRPYAPSHGFGQDPYLVREVGTERDQRTSFRNEVKDG